MRRWRRALWNPACGRDRRPRRTSARGKLEREGDSMVRSSSLGLALATLVATSALRVGLAGPAPATGLVFPVPAPPTDIVVSPTEKGVFLSWTGAPNVAGYNLYRRTADQTADKATLVNTAGP